MNTVIIKQSSYMLLLQENAVTTSSFIPHWMEYILPILFLIVIIVFAIHHIKEFLHTAWIFLKLLFRKNKSDLLDYFSFLLTANDKLLKEIISFNMLFRNLETQLNLIIKKYTTITSETVKYGIYDKVETKYYLDLQKACIENNNYLEKLALILSFNVIQNSDSYKQGKISHLCAQASGNIILAHKVSEILGIPLLIVGSLEGKQNTIFGDFCSNDVVIIIDDICSSGGMLRNSLNILHDSQLKIESIYTIIKRNTKCEIEVASFSDKIGQEIKIIPFKTLLDDELVHVLGIMG